MMPNPTAAMLVIGDEILSGRTRDANMHYLAGQLTEHRHRPERGARRQRRPRRDHRGGAGLVSGL